MPYQAKNKTTLVPEPWTKVDVEVYEKLVDVAKRCRKNTTKAWATPHISSIEDFAKDYEGLMADYCFNCLDVVSLEGFITNLTPAEKRTLCSRGALDYLGHMSKAVPAGVGAQGARRSYHQ